MTEQKLWKEKIWIIDTSSILQIKHDREMTANEKELIWRELAEKVSGGQVGFPVQVLREITKQGINDVPSEWASKMHEDHLESSPGKDLFNPDKKIPG